MNSNNSRKYKKGYIRVGICRHTKKEVLQYYDGVSDDADDMRGWLCLHNDEEEEELKRFKSKSNSKK